MRVAINGFGRIGRTLCRLLLSQNEVDIVAINDLANVDTLAHLFKYDSSHGTFQGDVQHSSTGLIINQQNIKCYQEKNPEQLPWQALNIDLVIECTGHFRTRAAATKHLQAGARRVLLSAPAQSADIPTFVLGINEALYRPDMDIISNASCTTNCLAPMVKIMQREFGLQHALMTTVHAYTTNQRLQDAPHSDLRRARAAAVNMIPTTTGAADALALVMPEIKGKIFASAVRVPILCGSLTELNCLLASPTTPERVNAAFKTAAEGEFKGILEYSEAPLVSSDIRSNPHSAIFDAPLTRTQGPMLKITTWYDNEAGFTHRLAEMAIYIGT